MRPRYLAACLLALMACVAPAAWATPFLPAADTVVLETLPDAGDRAAQALRAKHRALAANPRNLALALDVARGDLDRSRALGDPRFLGRAQSALAPWPPTAAAPPDTLLLRAVILQSNHDFFGALGLLDQVLRARPGNAQAWLTRAAIRQAQADYPGALSRLRPVGKPWCWALHPDICTASAMSLTGHAPLAHCVRSACR